MPKRDRHPSGLTQRQMQLVEFVVSKGLTNAEIACVLDITTGTVRSRISLIMQRLGLKSSFFLFDRFAYLVPKPETITTVELTQRELQVLELIKESNQTIASTIHIALPTLETYIRSIFDKCEVRSRRELLCKFNRFNFVQRKYIHPLTEERMEIVRGAIARGCTRRQMCDLLGISHSSVGCYVRRIWEEEHGQQKRA